MNPDDLDLKLREARQAAGELARRQRLADELPALEAQAATRARQAQARQAIEAIKANITQTEPELRQAVKIRNEAIHQLIQTYTELLHLADRTQAILNAISYDFRQLALESLRVADQITPGMSVAYIENLVDTESARLRSEMNLENPTQFSSYSTDSDVQNLLAFLVQTIGLDWHNPPAYEVPVDAFARGHDGLTALERMQRARMNPSLSDAKLFEP